MLEIEIPSTGTKLQVANQEFSDQLTWEDAQKVSSELDGGWRLPNREELEAMYQQLHKKKKGDFKKGKYWCSIEHSTNFAWYYNFKDGYAAKGLKTIPYFVRAVRAF